MKNYIVYLLVNPFNQKPFYVGSTNDAAARLSQHASSFGNSMRREIMDAIKASGEKVIMVEVDNLPDSKSALSAEVFWTETFLRSGAHLVNGQVVEHLRQAARAAHLAACSSQASAISNTPYFGADADSTTSRPTEPETAAAALEKLENLPPVQLPPFAVANPQDRNAARRINIGRPERHGAPWADNELKFLTGKYLEGQGVGEIASYHKRSEGSIIAKLRALGAADSAVLDKLKLDGLLLESDLPLQIKAVLHGNI